MAKNLRKRTPRIGLLTDTERKAIIEKRISKDTRWELTNLKNGVLPIYFKQIAEDFSIILDSGEFNNWIENFETVQSIIKLKETLDAAFSFSSFPIFRLASTIKDGQRKFYVKQIDYGTIKRTDRHLQSYILEQFTKGLKQNEKFFLQKYVEKFGYTTLPFKEKMYYTWNDVKNALEQKMAPPPPPSDEVQETIRKKMDRAWELINQKIDPETKAQIIKETGFSIRLSGTVSS